MDARTDFDFSRKIRVTIDSHWELGSHADWFRNQPTVVLHVATVSSNLERDLGELEQVLRDFDCIIFEEAAPIVNCPVLYIEEGIILRDAEDLIEFTGAESFCGFNCKRSTHF
jgi:hypothetical protein